MNTHSVACWMPTRRGRNHDEQASGTMPRRANTNPMRAFSDASRMSIGSVIVTPTPTAGPLIAAITGFRLSKIRSDTRPPPSRGTPVGPGLVAPATGGERLATARQVGAGAEAAAAPGDDDRPHLVVGVGAVEGIDQLAHHRAGEGVELVGAVERDGGDRAVDVVGDLRVRPRAPTLAELRAAATATPAGSA